MALTGRRRPDRGSPRLPRAAALRRSGLVSSTARASSATTEHGWSTSTTRANNEFLAVNQFTIIDGGKNRRPDILLFVNGLPLGQIELKAPGIDDSAEAAVNQVRHYTETIPDLYRYVEIVGVSDLLTARVGDDARTPAEHFAQWKTMERGQASAGRSSR